MPKTTKRRGYHHGNLRQALIDSALALIREKGVQGVTIREAARRAGVSSGAPYRHFPDKQALLEAVAGQGLELLAEMRDRQIAGAGQDPVARFRAMGVAYVKFAVAHPSHFRVMTDPELAGDNQPDVLREETAANERAIRSILDASKKSGQVREADTDVLMLAAQCLVHGLARMLVDGQLPNQGIDETQAEAIANAVTEVFGYGLLQR